MQHQLAGIRRGGKDMGAGRELHPGRGRDAGSGAPAGAVGLKKAVLAHKAHHQRDHGQNQQQRKNDDGGQGSAIGSRPCCF